MTIKNIIFDLGGVVITLDRSRAVRRLEELGVADANDLLGLYRQDGIFLNLETGKITTDEFYDALQEKIRASKGEYIENRRIRDAFNAFLIELPLPRLQAIREAREKGFKLYVLSNTNPVMYDSWIKEAFQQEGMHVDDYFDGIVKSFSEGICKPNEKIFERVLERYHLKAEETLMLDDSEENCESARRTGMQAIKVDLQPPRDLVGILNELFKDT